MINFLFFLLFISFFQFSSQAKLKSSPNYQLFLNGEKPLLSKESISHSVDIVMAKNEFEIFSIRFPSQKPLELISEVRLNWKKTNKDKISNSVEIKTYWLGVHNLKKSSSKYNFKPNEVSDIPIPLELLKMNEIQVPPNNIPNSAQYLFEIYTDPNSPSGTYEADLNFKLGKLNYSLPFKITIHSLTLPNQFELATSFGFAPWEVLKKHYGSWHKDELSLYEMYLDKALEHRIDLHKIYIKFPEADALDPLNDSPQKYQSFLSQVTPLFKGTLNTKRFAFSATDLPVPEEYKLLSPSAKQPENKTRDFWKKLNQSVLKNKLQDKTYVFFVDEPQADQIKNIATQIRKIRKWAPDLKFLVTTPYQDSLDGAINLWCLNLFLWDRPTEKSPEFYIQRKQKHKEDFWFYISCNSHGCEDAEDIEIPDLAMDRPAAYHRAFPWYAQKFQAGGILYYDTVYGYSHGGAQSPWVDNFNFTGYGEGNLFYPCTKAIGHCQKPIVIPSLRLKILRDGLEDIQILKMVEKKGIKVDKLVNKIIPATRNFSKNNHDFDELKRQVLKSYDDK